MFPERQEFNTDHREHLKSDVYVPEDAEQWWALRTVGKTVDEYQLQTASSSYKKSETNKMKTKGWNLYYSLS